MVKMQSTHLLVILFLFILIMSAPKVEAASKQDPFIVSLCEYAKIDNRFQIRKKLKGARLKLRKAYPAIRCEGKKLHAYAVENNALEVIKFIEAKIKAEKR
jgi:hypothetical protein